MEEAKRAMVIPDRENSVRIMTWNVNGIKTLPQYHPWNAFKSYEGVFQALKADIICIQETKITRAQVDKSLACTPSYDTFMSFYRRTPPRGIHGTAIVTRRATCIPVKAEEGIGDTLLPASLGESARIGGYPEADDIEYGEEAMRDLDLEGRTTVCDFGLFVLINLYCPNETNEARLLFKNAFNAMVEHRVRRLIRAGRQVIVAGDLNACYMDLDTAEPELRAKNRGLENFTDHAPRTWLKNLVAEKTGLLIDITRKLHPTREKMYTCWETKIDARPSNYGTRLDFLLITPGLLPWVKHSDILPSVFGSDHCPVYLDLHPSITLPGRGEVHLWDEMNPPGRPKGVDGAEWKPPAFAASNYDEFSGKQKLLSSFFGKGAALAAAAKKEMQKADVGAPISSSAPIKSSAPSSSSQSSASASTSKLSSSQPTKSSSTTTAPSRPALTAKTSSSSSVKGKGKAQPEPIQQTSLASFFKPPPKPKPVKKAKSTSSSSGSTKKKVIPAATPPPRASTSSPPMALDLTGDDEGPNQAQSQLPSQPQDDTPFDWSIEEEDSMVAAETVAAWSSIFAPKDLPLCDGHNEPSKAWTVGKPGVNKGRKFYLCSRPVGPGYDRGKGQAKVDVNSIYRCNFFQWDISVKRPAGMGVTGSSKKQKT